MKEKCIFWFLRWCNRRRKRPWAIPRNFPRIRYGAGGFSSDTARIRLGLLGCAFFVIENHFSDWTKIKFMAATGTNRPNITFRCSIPRLLSILSRPCSVIPSSAYVLRGASRPHPYPSRDLPLRPTPQTLFKLERKFMLNVRLIFQTSAFVRKNFFLGRKFQFSICSRLVSSPRSTYIYL